MNLSYESIFTSTKMKKMILTDLKGLFDTITALHGPKEYRLRKMVARIRHSFESGALDGVRRIEHKFNLADSLTRFNDGLWVQLNALLRRREWYGNLND